jgi:diacylglycerol kinase family enzyme
MKVFLIVNGSASTVTPRARVLIQRALSVQFDVTVAETARRGHATRLARGAVADGADAVVVLGGDGTLNEAANGLAGSHVTLGTLPGGSTNVFARTLGYTNDPVDATAELLEAMKENRQRRIGLGNANGRYFLFHVGIGFDAAVIERVERRASLKRYAGHPLFVWTTLLTWARLAGHKTPRFAVQFPPRNGITQAPVAGYLTICLNSNPYTFLGNRPFTIDPSLTFEKGLAIMTVKSLDLPTFGTIVGSALMTGRNLRRHPRTDFRTDVRECEIVGYEKFPYQLDGDYLGDVESLSLHHEPDMLNVYLPKVPASS